MVSLFLRNLIFTILQPGLVAGLVPYWIVRNETNVWPIPLIGATEYLGSLIFVIGTTIMFLCIGSFAVKGRGTLSPIDPTQKLVITGLYRFSRNPMYVGVMLMLVGESILYRSTSLTIYSAIVFLTFNIFIQLVEEPRLRKDFKEEYDNYCQAVRRWI